MGTLKGTMVGYGVIFKDHLGSPIFATVVSCHPSSIIFYEILDSRMDLEKIWHHHITSVMVIPDSRLAIDNVNHCCGFVMGS